MRQSVRLAILLCVSVTLVVSFHPRPGFSAEFTMKCGTPDPPDGSLSVMASWAMQEIKKRSNGRIEGKVFPSSQLGNNVQRTEQLQLGTLECTLGAVAFLSGAYAPVTMFDLPFIFPDDPDVVRQVVLHGKAARWMLDDMDRVGLKGIAFHMTGYKHFTTSKVPVAKLEDMQGIKFRAMTSPILLAQFKALGANAIPIPFAEVYNALQSGVAEGQENPYWAIHKMRFFEVQKYLSVSSHGLIVVYILASKHWWNKLPIDLQAIIAEVFVEGEAVTWEVNERIDREAVTAMKAAGLRFITLAPEERERFRQATANVKQVYIKRLGATGEKLLTMLEADIAAFSK